jgi:peptide deformylase
MTDILPQNEPVLREIAQDVPLSEITSPQIQKVLKNMKTALDSQEDGVAIAAPQIGAPLRIFLISGAVMDMIKEQETGIQGPPTKDLVFINPVISKLSKTSAWMEEGCLSVRYWYGKVKRATKATITAYDENGIKFTRGGSGIMAQIFQHETDHLNGILFTDKAKDLEDLPPETKK